jgi:uncharacterized protein YbaR (Trm112 family)
VSQTPTTIEPWLREILRCPQCKGELTDSTGAASAETPSGASEGGDPITAPVTELQCPTCRLGYPIESGVPVLLVDLARRLG